MRDWDECGFLVGTAVGPSIANVSFAFTNATHLRFKSTAIDITRMIYTTKGISLAGIMGASRMERLQGLR
jgi:hypothetical protein